MKEIWIQSVIVPGVVRIILAFPMSLGHPPGGSGQTVCDIGPENWSKEIEPGVERTHKLVVWMSTEAFVSQKIWECVLELINSMLHQSEAAESEETHSWNGVGSPVSVEIHFDSSVEDTISALNGISFNSLSEISGLCWERLDFILWRSCIALIKAQE